MRDDARPTRTTAGQVRAILDTLEDGGIDVWVGGGWGIDALAGEQTRPHSDVDICVPHSQSDRARQALEGIGLAVLADERPTRLLLGGAGRGFVDLHPIELRPHGGAILRGPNGAEFEFAPGSLEGTGTIDGWPVRCFSVDRQREAHAGYEPREIDLIDLRLLDRLAGRAGGGPRHAGGRERVHSGLSAVRQADPQAMEQAMAYVVDFTNVSTTGLETSPVARALAGLRANEARYFKNKYGHDFTVEPAGEASEIVDWVQRVLKEERDLVITARPLEATIFRVENIKWAYVFYESGLSINVLYTLDDASKRAVGFKLSDGMDVPAELSKFKFARQKSKLAGTIRGSFFVIKGEY